MWVKLDDKINQHPKMLAAGPLAQLLYFRGLVYCGQYLTDGFIPIDVVKTLIDWTGVARVSTVTHELTHWSVRCQGSARCKLIETPNNLALAAALVSAGLWHDAPGGYQVHDYLEYNISREQVLSKAQRLGTRAVKAAHARWNRRTKNDTQKKQDERCLTGCLSDAKSCPVPDVLLSSLRSDSSPEGIPIPSDSQGTKAADAASPAPEVRFPENNPSEGGKPTEAPLFAELLGEPKEPPAPRSRKRRSKDPSPAAMRENAVVATVSKHARQVFQARYGDDLVLGYPDIRDLRHVAKTLHAGDSDEHRDAATERLCAAYSLFADRCGDGLYNFGDKHVLPIIPQFARRINTLLHDVPRAEPIRAPPAPDEARCRTIRVMVADNRLPWTREGLAQCPGVGAHEIEPAMAFWGLVEQTERKEGERGGAGA